MFFTGAFELIGDDCLNTIHKIHDKEKYDDDVTSWILEDGDVDVFSDGYVSNEGNFITIHVRPEINNDKTIELIKDFFDVEEDDSCEIIVVEFLGWEAESAISRY